MVNEWIKDQEYERTYYKIKKINTTYYKIQISLFMTEKSVKVIVGASSGKKRKHLNSFEPNDFNRDGGIKALFWLKDETLNCINFVREKYFVDDLRQYICIGWADSKRRNVYSRLLKEGFTFTIEEGEKILIKRYK